MRLSNLPVVVTFYSEQPNLSGVTHFEELDDATRFACQHSEQSIVSSCTVFLRDNESLDPHCVYKAGKRV